MVKFPVATCELRVEERFPVSEVQTGVVSTNTSDKIIVINCSGLFVASSNNQRAFSIKGS